MYTDKIYGYSAGFRYSFHREDFDGSCEVLLWGQELGCSEWEYCPFNQKEGTDQTGNIFWSFKGTLHCGLLQSLLKVFWQHIHTTCILLKPTSIYMVDFHDLIAHLLLKTVCFRYECMHSHPNEPTSTCIFVCVCLYQCIYTINWITWLQAVTKMIQEACTYVEKTPNLDIKLKLIDTLRTVTAGKVQSGWE